MERSRTRSRVSSKPLLEIVAARPLEGFELEIDLSDGRTVIRDFAALVSRARGVLLRLAKPAFFRKVRVVAGALTWPGEIDLCPLATIYGDTWMSKRRRVAVRASA